MGFRGAPEFAAFTLQHGAELLYHIDSGIPQSCVLTAETLETEAEQPLKDKVLNNSNAKLKYLLDRVQRHKATRRSLGLTLYTIHKTSLAVLDKPYPPILDLEIRAS